MSQEETVQIRIQSKVDSKAGWVSHNPILLDREIGYERETGKYKIGDDITPWNDLPYAEYATKEDIGKIETALDNIIAIQNTLIGGESV